MALITRWASSVALAGLLAGTASASSVSGDPLADGWVFGGNSLALGNYVRGDGVFDYGLYTSAFSLSSGSNLVGSGWQAGDSILGIGGVITPGAANPNLTQSVRLVAKFGTSPSAWQASTITPTGGNGLGSFSGGAGGDGAILLGTDGPTQGTGSLNPGSSRFVGPGNPGPGNVFEIPLAQRYDGGGVSAMPTSIGKFIFQFDTNDVLSSWQVLLNRDVLGAQLGAGAEIPGLGDRAIVTLQRSVNSTLFTDSLITVVPAPGALALLGLGGLCATRRRRGA